MAMNKLKKVSDAALAELMQAYAPFDHLPPEETERLLQEHQARQRAAKLSAITTLGVIGALSLKAEGPTHADLDRLANARREIREASTPQGAAKRISDPIARQVFVKVRKGRDGERGPVYDVEAIRAEATHKGYWSEGLERGGKLRIRNEIIESQKLREQNKATSKESMHRALERILKPS